MVRERPSLHAQEQEPDQIFESDKAYTRLTEQVSTGQNVLPFSLTRDDWKEVSDILSSEIPEPLSSGRLASIRESLQKPYEDLKTHRRSLIDIFHKLDRAHLADQLAAELLQEHAQGIDILQKLQDSFGIASIDDLEGFQTNLNEQRNNLQISTRIALANYLRDHAAYVREWGRKETPPLIPLALVEYMPLQSEDKAAHSFASFVLRTQYDLLGEKPSFSPSDISGETQMLMVLSMKRGIDVRGDLDFLSLSSDEQIKAVEEYLLASGLTVNSITPKHSASARLILGYLSKHKDRIQESLQRSDEDEEMIRFSDALRAAQSSGHSFEMIQKFIESGGEISVADIRETVENAVTNALETKQISRILYAASEHHETGFRYEELTPEQQEFHALDAEFVARFMVGTEGKSISVMDLDSYYGGKQLMLPTQETMVRAICSSATSQASCDKAISLLTHRTSGLLESSTSTVANTILGSLNPQTEDALREIILQKKLTLKEAFELFYLSESTGGKGSLSETMKLIDLLEHHQYHELADRWKTIIRVDLLEAAYYYSMGQAGKAKETLSHFNLGPEQERELQNMMKYCEEIGMGGLYKWFTRFVQLYAEAPRFMTALTAGTLYAGGKIGHGLALGGVDSWHYAKWAIPGLRETSIPKLRAFVDMKPSVLLEKFGSDMPLERLQNLQGRILTLLDEYPKYKLNVSTRLAKIREAVAIRRVAGHSLDDISRAMYQSQDVSRASRLFGSPRLSSSVDLASVLYGLEPSDSAAVLRAMKSVGIAEAEAELALFTVKDRPTALADLADEMRALDGAPVEKVHTFMQKLEAIEKIDPSARRMLGEKVWDSPLTDDQWKMLEKAHAEPNLRKKMQILENLEGDAKALSITERRAVRTRASKFLRVGIAGEVPTTVITGPIRSVEQFKALLSRLTPDEIVESLRTLPRVASELDPNEYARLLRDSSVREHVKGSKALAALDDLERASEQSLKALRKSGLAHAGGRMAGRALMLFGVYMEYVYVRESYKDLQEAIKSGDKAREEVMRSRLFSNSVSAVSSVGVGGLMTIGVVGGPVGLGVVAAIMTSNASSEYLYSYALDLNEITPTAYRGKSTAELVSILRGRQDWLLDGSAQRELRYETALDAYVLKKAQQGMITFDDLDDAYLREVVAYDPHFEVDPYSEGSLAPLRPRILDTKIIYWTHDMRDYMRQHFPDKNADGGEWSRALEDASLHAERKHIERRAEQLEQPEIVAEYTHIEGDQNFATAVENLKAQELLMKLLMISAEEDANGLQIMIESALAVGRALEFYDVDVYRSEYFNQKQYDREPYEWTLSKITMDTTRRLTKSLHQPEEFTRIYIEAKKGVRSLLAPAKPAKRSFRDNIEHSSNNFGPTVEAPSLRTSDLER